jgi:DNA repair protein RecO (recombination protein O)
MPLRETEAVVLRTYRLGEADKIASLFTRQLGRLRGVAGGAQRPKSRYGGTLEPLSYIRLWIFERENRDLLRINSAELIESFFDMQKDYRVQVAAQFVAEVADRFLPEREANDRAFRLLLAVLRAMKHSGEVERPLVYFDYWLLRLGGFLPDFERCASCGRPLGSEPVYFTAGAEGLLCGDCRPSQAQQFGPREALTCVVSHCQATLDRWLGEGKPSEGLLETRHFLEQLIEAHLEKKLITRPMLDEV